VKTTIDVAQDLTATAHLFRGRPLPPTFWAKVEKTPDCWLWTGCCSSEGYGVYGHGARLVHRLVYSEIVGPIPEASMIDHRCRVRRCCNPEHLQPASNKLNQENRSGPPSNNTSGVRGVCWAADHNKWRVLVRHEGKRYHGGHFADIAQAERAAIELRNELHTNNLEDRTSA
jgi:hypothetical protein